MASEATNELGPSIDPNELRETAKNQQESSPREEQDTKEFDLKDKRHRTRSEKGLQMDLDNARTKRDRAGNALKNQIEFVDDLLRQSKDIIALAAGLESLQMKMDSLKSLHETIVNVTLELHEDDTGDFDYFSSLSDLFADCVADVKARIKMLEEERAELLSQRSRSSIRSGRTSTSKNSQRTSSSMRAAAEAAALQVKMNSLKRQQELDRKQELLKHQQRELERLEEQERLQGELEAAKARRDILEKLVEKTSPKAIEDLENNVSETNPQRQENQNSESNEELNVDNIVSVPAAQLSPRAPVFSPASIETQLSSQLQKLQQENTEIQRQQLQLLKKMTLPIPKPPVFSGNILEYPKWSSAFDALIEEDAVKPSHKLYYLGEYTTGKAQTMINGLLGLQTEDAYSRARNILKDRFGDPFKVYEAYRQKLWAWPVCSTATELQEFSDFLVMTEETMKTVKYLKEFDNFSAIRQLAARLPTYYTNKWRDAAKKVESKSGEYTFHNFVSYVQEAASDATHPVFSHEALAATRKEINHGGNKDNKRPISERKRDSNIRVGSTFATNTGNEERVENKPSPNKVKCFLCHKPHELEHCEEFLKKSVTERKEYARAKGLCFACLARGHMTRQCEQKKKCRICKKPHVTALHLYEPVAPKKDGQLEDSNGDESERVTSNCVSVCHASNGNATSNATSALIVPVWLHHKDDPEREIQVYAVLDDRSDTCFITDEVCEKLGLEGPEVTLQLGTMHAVENINTMKINGLIVSRHDKLVKIDLPKLYTRDQIPARKEQIPRPETAQAWKHLRPIASKIPAYHQDLKVGVLIGNNCVQAIKPREVIPGRPRDPYAIRTALGWGLIGAPLSKSENEVEDTIIHSECFRITTKEIGIEETPARCFVQQVHHKEVISPVTVSKMFERDFSEGERHSKALSQEDRRFLQNMKEGIHLTADHHYEMPLPFRQDKTELPSNRKTAETRLHQLKRRFTRNPKYKQDYVSFMNEVIRAGYAERAPKDNPKSWYLPHHGVYHPKKPGKIRVVFDCSAEFEGHSLNRQLLQGPDLTNSLLGVLCRFRQEPVAFACDIEGMFHQVNVNEEHRDYLRFLWWDQGDTTKEPTEYRMTVHLFGAASSPGCANLALKTTAEDNEKDLGSEAAEFLSKNFYVDDGLKSVKTVKEAIALIQKSKEMCKEGGFRLHKFISNRKEVIESIPAEDRAKGIKDLDLEHEELPSERVLGIEWCVESDAFQFRITLKDKPFTRRGILSTVSSIYDPLGFAAPFLLQGKRILQDLCKEKVEWDDPIPDELRARWEKWRSELVLLEEMKIRRCYKPNNFGKLKSIEVHHFSDASADGYGQCSYLRLVDDKNRIHCSFLLGKARVTPLKPVTIPRLELTAALVSVKVSQTLQEELEYDQVDEFFWTDSKVVLGYINNDARRFHTFVANRVQQIRDHTSLKQWLYIDTKNNPADDASRGLSAKSLVERKRWINGPAFLWDNDDCWKTPDLEHNMIKLAPDDKEVKKVSIFATAVKEEPISLLQRLEYFSDWFRAKRAIAVCRRYLYALLERVRSRKVQPQDVNKTATQKSQTVGIEELKSAEREIIKQVQGDAFEKDIKTLMSLTSTNQMQRDEARKRNQEIRQASMLYRLDPFLDREGILRVGGRIQQASLHEDIKNPVILPKKGHVTELLIKDFHEKAHHQGRGFTLNEIRSNGYWIIGCSGAVSSFIKNCVTCQRLRAKVQEQKMAELPKERVEPFPPFTYCGVDLFGPWYVKEGRKELKRYGLLFTCMASRAIHLEVCNTMETDSFLNALRRFICRRGPIRQLRADQGSNFIGAKRELREALDEMDQNKIKSDLLKRNCDWIEFNFNAPKASNMGGVWERQIRTVRSVLTALLEKNGSQLNDEALRTFMCEAEAVVNSRPLTSDNTTSSLSPEALTPNHLLTMKTKIILPPPGVFQDADKYSRKQWRRVQHLTNEFWTRWRKEFLHALQERQKWVRSRRNMQIGDIVLVKDDNTPRNQWQLARVTEAQRGNDGLVRKVNLAIGDRQLTASGKRTKPVSILERPIHKLVLLVPFNSHERPGVPDEEPDHDP